MVRSGRGAGDDHVHPKHMEKLSILFMALRA